MERGRGGGPPLGPSFPPTHRGNYIIVSIIIKVIIIVIITLVE